MMPDTSEPIRIGELEIRYLLDGVELAAASGLFELMAPPGARVPPAHSHNDNEEIVYVLDGVLQYTVDAVTRDLRNGDHMRTPRGLSTVSAIRIRNPPAPWSH